jgi:hypothetical protein
MRDNLEQLIAENKRLSNELNFYKPEISFTYNAQENQVVFTNKQANKVNTSVFTGDYELELFVHDTDNSRDEILEDLCKTFKQLIALEVDPLISKIKANIQLKHKTGDT